MSRPLRIIYEGAWYHVMNRGRRGEKIFSEAGDYKAFIDLLKESSRMWQVRIAAFCLMSNHYHLLLQTPRPNLSRCMRHINGIYTQRYNRMYSSDGQLFRGRYKAILVDADSYLLELVRYIHRNPVRAGRAQHISDYTWCSHQEYISKKEKWNWIYKAFVLDMLDPHKGSQRRAYNTFVAHEDSRGILSFFQKKNIPAVLGSDAFIEKIKHKHFNKKRHQEVPESRALAPNIDKIKQAVCNTCNVNPNDLLVSKRGTTNEARNMAIYLIRQYRGEKLERIGREFNISNYSTVSSIIVKVGNELRKNKRLKQRIRNIAKQISNSQKQT